MVSLFKQFGHILYFIFSPVQRRLQLLLPDDGDPVYFFDFVDCGGANIAARLSLLSHHQKRYISQYFDPQQRMEIDIRRPHTCVVCFELVLARCYHGEGRIPEMQQFIDSLRVEQYHGILFEA